MFKFLGDKIKKEKNKVLSYSENVSVFQTIKEIKKESSNEDKLSDKDKNFDKLYSDAFDDFNMFYENNSFNVDFLKKASEKLASAIELRPSKPKPYLLLAYIYYIIGNISLSVKYMKITQQLDNTLPQIVQLQDLLNKKL
ncbi:MAG: hypothetical protein AABZ74_04960 [Cyanobacteriota bacterium]